jgi:hypothetical protein
MIRSTEHLRLFGYYLSQILLGELTEIVRNRLRDAQRHWSIANNLPSEAIANGIDRAVGAPPRPTPLGARAAGLILQSNRQLELQDGMLLQVRN